MISNDNVHDLPENTVWEVYRHEYYKQEVIIVGDNGNQERTTIKCVVTNQDRPKIQYPRSIKVDGKVYIMFKYSEKEDVVFYKKAKK